MGFVGTSGLRIGRRDVAVVCPRRVGGLDGTVHRRRANVVPRMTKKNDPVRKSVEEVEDIGPYVRQLLGWVGVAIATGVGVYYVDGGARAQEFAAGYIIEQSLSVDNLFVFLLIFNYFKVPIHAQEKVLNWGIFGAVVMRGIMIIAGEELIKKFEITSLFLGALLFYSSVNILLSADSDEEEDLSDNFIVKTSKKLFKTVDFYDGENFFTKVMDGDIMRRVATPLLICMITVEVSDVIFALDSVPAVLGISRDWKVVYLSNILAICGLRSLYFILESVIGSLRYLPQSLAIVLSFVGAKLCGSYFGLTVDTSLSLGIVVSTLGVGVAASLLNPEDEDLPPAGAEKKSA
ncbi:hypothetical protein NDN08_002038 [Rhodosorus marinus]|uniref:Uncharacterized protein n=1 Tax=Rhodosorus marinus TaxID=101924 RepID=A0AAV8UYE3_9RHOD|nr:hypothetical protein NDN08_002038 [Rhodosorus marinus]